MGGFSEQGKNADATAKIGTGDLYSVTVTGQVQLVTLVRAHSADEAKAIASTRKLESAWRETQHGEGALSHWLITDLPGYPGKDANITAKVV